MNTLRATSGAATDRTAVAVVGLGYVGLPLAILTATKGYQVIGFDIDEIKVAQLEARDASFLSDEESAAFKKAKRLAVTATEKDIRGLGTYIICVPTPVHGNREPDLAPLEGAAEIVGKSLAEGSLVIVESTVNPGVCEEVVLPLLEKHSGITRHEFRFAHCPERINPGDPEWNVHNIPRVVGGVDTASREAAAAFYRSIIDADVIEMNTVKEAEAVKMVENSFRDINIAFVNELAMAFDRAGIDITNVLRGASSKPFGFMPHYPGCGVGGHCIPVDPYYLIRYGRKNGFEHHFLKTARRINSGMPHYTVRLLAEELRASRRTLKGATVALLGLSYKPNVGDKRESPALVIRALLEKRGAKVKTYDPHLGYESTEASAEDALRDADAAIIATGHREFAKLTPRSFEKQGVYIVVDGRNTLDKDAFERSVVRYRGIGR